MYRDLKDIGLTWHEADELAHSRSSWRQCVSMTWDERPGAVSQDRVTLNQHARLSKSEVL